MLVLSPAHAAFACAGLGLGNNSLHWHIVHTHSRQAHEGLQLWHLCGAAAAAVATASIAAAVARAGSVTAIAISTTATPGWLFCTWPLAAACAGAAAVVGGCRGQGPVQG